MAIRKTMKVFLALSLLSTAKETFAQKKFTISGTVTSKNSGESIIGASIKVLNSNYGTISNEYGFYSLLLAADTYQIVYSAVGKTPDTVQINLSGNIEKTFRSQKPITNWQRLPLPAVKLPAARLAALKWVSKTIGTGSQKPTGDLW